MHTSLNSCGSFIRSEWFFSVHTLLASRGLTQMSIFSWSCLTVAQVPSRRPVIRRRIHPGFPLDLVVRSPAVIRHRLSMGDGFIREILETGKVLHEAPGR